MVVVVKISKQITFKCTGSFSGPSSSPSRRSPTSSCSSPCSSSSTPSLACRLSMSTQLSVWTPPISNPNVTVSITKVFGSLHFDPDTEYNRHNNFKTFFAGLCLLFRWVEAQTLDPDPQELLTQLCCWPHDAHSLFLKGARARKADNVKYLQSIKADTRPALAPASGQCFLLLPTFS